MQHAGIFTISNEYSYRIKHDSTRCLYHQAVAVVRTPHAADALVDAGNGLAQFLVLLAIRVTQPLCLLQYLARLETPHANGPISAIDVVSYDDRVLRRPRGDSDFDLRVLGGKLGEVCLNEGAATTESQTQGWTIIQKRKGWRSLLHALGASGPVAVVKVHPLALQDECPQAILYAALVPIHL